MVGSTTMLYFLLTSWKGETDGVGNSEMETLFLIYPASCILYPES